MMKVLYLLDVLDGFGGTERQLRELIQHMDRSRFEPVIMSLYSGSASGATGFNGIRCEVHCLRMRRLGGVSGMLATLRLATWLRRQRIDLVHTFFPDASIVGIVAARLAGKRVVVGRRDLGYWSTPRYIAVLRTLQRLADAYIVNSIAVRSAVKQTEGVDESRIHVVPNGFFDVPASRPNATPRELGLAGGGQLVGIVANLREVKRLDRFIDMAAAIRNPRVSFLIVGAGHLHDALRRRADLVGLGSRLRIIHSIAETMSLIASFRVGVLTSESEGLSNTLIEYGLAGVPAVAFDVGGNREVIDDAETGFLIEPYDISSMRARVEDLISDDLLRDRMGSRAQIVCSDRFAGTKMVASIQGIYDRIAAERV
jgi:glycosyltransferase involved in cell wall biosynthesis